MTDRIWDRVFDAALLIEKGQDIPQIARSFGVTPSCLRQQLGKYLEIQAALRMDFLLDDVETLESVNREIALVQERMGPTWNRFQRVEPATPEEIEAIRDDSKPLPERIKVDFFWCRHQLNEAMQKRILS